MQREGSGPNPFSCTWPPRRREPCCYLALSPPRSPERYQRLAPSPRGRGKQGGGGSSPPPRLGSARLGWAAWSHSAPSRDKAPPPARRLRGAARLRSGSRPRGDGDRGGGCPCLVLRTKRRDALRLADLHPRFQAYGIFILVFELWRYIYIHIFIYYLFIFLNLPASAAHTVLTPSPGQTLEIHIHPFLGVGREPARTHQFLTRASFCSAFLSNALSAGIRTSA